MFSRPTTIRLVLFVVIAVVGVGFTGARYAGLDRLFGSGGYEVTVQLTDSGGLFTNSEVSYRGVAVGRVQELRLTETGMAADLYLESGKPDIPADTRAVVANRSAVGEQYIDLRPPDEGGPYLEDGSVIPVNRTELPPSPESLLINLDNLVTSIPTDALRTVVDEAGTAFQGSGPHLQRILDGASALTEVANNHLPETTELLSNGDTVLRTQQEQASRITSFSRGVREISAQLKESDPDIRRVIKAAPAAGREIDALLRESRTDFGVVTANLLTTAEIMKVRTSAIEHLLVALPVVSAASHSATDGDGRGHLGVVLNFFNPIACMKGYEDTPRRPGSETSPAPPNGDFECAEPPGSPINVRGSGNVPRPPVAAAVPAPEQDGPLMPLPPEPNG